MGFLRRFAHPLALLVAVLRLLAPGDGGRGFAQTLASNIVLYYFALVARGRLLFLGSTFFIGVNGPPATGVAFYKSDAGAAVVGCRFVLWAASLAFRGLSAWGAGLLQPSGAPGPASPPVFHLSWPVYRQSSMYRLSLAACFSKTPDFLCH